MSYMNYNNNHKVGKVIKAILEGDVSGLGVGVLQPNIPATPDTNPTPEPIPDNSNFQLNDLEMEQQITGPEDPIKRFIDKLVDTKNKVLDNNSKMEIQKTINNVKL